MNFTQCQNRSIGKNALNPANSIWHNSCKQRADYEDVDGIPVAATNFVPIGSSGYWGAQLPVTNAVHRVTSLQPVGVEVYGFRRDDAYGYFGGIVK